MENCKTTGQRRTRTEKEANLGEHVAVAEMTELVINTTEYSKHVGD